MVDNRPEPVKENREPSPAADRARKVLHYWFVRYNPLYFFSALCVLAGVFLVSKGLSDLGWKQGQTLLALVMQVYEILLIAGAALLFRKAGQRRPAVILGLMEVFFLFDCTLQTEMAGGLGGLGVVVTVAWILLLVLKMRALFWVFHLKPSPAASILPVLAAVGLAGMPHILETGGVYKIDFHLAATWYGVILALLALSLKPRVQCALDLDPWGQTVLLRSTKAALAIWAGFYFVHLIAWAVIYTVIINLEHFAPLFMLWFFARREFWHWAAAAIILLLTAHLPASIAPVALFLTAVFVLKARQTRNNRMYVAAVLCLYIAVWTLGWKGGGIPPSILWLNLAAAAALILITWRFRLVTAGAATVLVLLPIAGNLVPKTILQWGIAILAAGFIALITGVAVNWSMRKRADKPDERED